ncbi:MAG: hypothetical protein HFG14_04350 [Lachnospiraceae bacterium]|nr:hypothetical protein [Lachnospiraceae bacterium]NBJ83538.1 hypothetical protein [bacterium 1XD42-76]NBK06821.1 hypothetical protein [bacterium 1XD42-94]
MRTTGKSGERKGWENADDNERRIPPEKECRLPASGRDSVFRHGFTPEPEAEGINGERIRNYALVSGRNGSGSGK